MPSTPCSRASRRRATPRTNSRLALALAVGLAASLPPAGVRAGADAGGGGRKLGPTADPEFEPVLRGIESRLPAYDAAVESSLRIPVQTIELGLSNKMYHCWKLRLTGGHGRQTRGVMENLRSVQSAMKERLGALTQELAAYTAAPKPDLDARRRILAVRDDLDGLLRRYDTLIALGRRNGFLQSSDGGIFGERQTISPRLLKDDYTMVHDDTVPGCGPSSQPAEGGRGGNPGGPSGV